MWCSSTLRGVDEEEVEEEEEEEKDDEPAGSQVVSGNTEFGIPAGPPNCYGPRTRGINN